jgi:hypothetical protein
VIGITARALLRTTLNHRAHVSPIFGGDSSGCVGDSKEPRGAVSIVNLSTIPSFPKQSRTPVLGNFLGALLCGHLFTLHWRTAARLWFFGRGTCHAEVFPSSNPSSKMI